MGRPCRVCVGASLFGNCIQTKEKAFKDENTKRKILRKGSDE